jgi:aminotransferase
MQNRSGRSQRTATRTHGFTESVIREMTRVANEAGAINLSQGFPDFPAPEILKEAACDAIRADINQYAVTWGAPRLRRALAAKYENDYGMPVDETKEITVTCGATEAVASSLLGFVIAGDEVLIFEPL